MTIRTKLTLIFFTLVTFIVSIISVSIYFFSANYREADFYRRLKNRAVNTAVVLMQYKEIDAELFRQMELDNPASLPKQIVKIYDNNGTELYDLDQLNVVTVANDLIARVKKAGEVRFTQGDYEMLAFHYKPNDENLVIIAGATDVHGSNAMQNLRTIIVITFFLSLVAVSILGWIYSGRVLQPISRIVAEVDNISEANLNQRLDEGNRKDELSRLAQTFNRMLSRLEAAFKSQKNFIANASHELRTPFTVMAGEIEVTMLQPREKEYYIKILESVLHTIKRFNKLSTQLLLLAQTSTDNPQKRFASVRIDDILWESKNELEKMHSEYVIDIEFDLNIDHNFLMINGDDQLLKALMMNLMENGCKYSYDNKVVVTLFPRENDFVSIQLVNYGDGISPDEVSQIFSPFYRGRNKKKIQGFGIGLSLCEKIIGLHGGKISVESNQEADTRFTIELPISKHA